MKKYAEGELEVMLEKAVRNEAIEECARVAGSVVHFNSDEVIMRDNIVAAIRALKDKV